MTENECDGCGCFVEWPSYCVDCAAEICVNCAADVLGTRCEECAFDPRNIDDDEDY